MPGTNTTLEIFEQTGAYLKGHFRLTSGLHSSEYLQCARVLQHPNLAEHFGRRLANQFRELAAGREIQVAVSPAMGGLIIGHEVARALGVRHIFAEREDGKMALRRGFTVSPGEVSVVVEDVVTTGGSTREVIDLLRALGAEVAAAGSIIDRSGGSAQVGAPRVALATLTAAAWPPEACPLCAEGLPLVKPGSRQA